MKLIKAISIFIGISMFMFGFLKLFYPISEWFTIQILNSGLKSYLYWPGIASEILSGLLFLLVVIFRNKIPLKYYRRILLTGSIWVISIMSVAFYVHLQPDVPSYILPLKIKPPYLPAFYILLSLINIIFLQKQVIEPGISGEKKADKIYR